MQVITLNFVTLGPMALCLGMIVTQALTSEINLCGGSTSVIINNNKLHGRSVLRGIHILCSTVLLFNNSWGSKILGDPSVLVVIKFWGH